MSQSPFPRERNQLSLSFSSSRTVFTVAELTGKLQANLAKDFQIIWVSGEIASCKISPLGHYYFVLKGADGQIRCVFFKSSARFTRVSPKDGLAVLVRGSLDFYASRGELQFLVDQVELQGAGALQLAYEQLKEKLAAEGLFNPGRKKALPRLPASIGLVTSPAGAVLRDMLHIWERRFPGLQIVLYPVAVQGETAGQQISRAVRFFNSESFRHRCPGVIIVARGGGSAEDLAAFNSEEVARSIAGSVIPVISAVGHETDFTISDLVADHRAPTPSAAAEVVICTRQSLLDQIAGCGEQLNKLMRYRLLSARHTLQSRTLERAERSISRRVAHDHQDLDALNGRLFEAGQSAIARLDSRWQQLSDRLTRSDLRLRVGRSQGRHSGLVQRLTLSRVLELKRARLERAGEALSRRPIQLARLHALLNTFEARLQSLSPLSVLERGYAIVRMQDGRVVRSAQETEVGGALRIRLHQGSIGATVTEQGQE